VDCAIGMRCKAILQNVQLVSFQQEVILKERRVEGLNTLFCLTVMHYQGNVHLCKDGVTDIRLESRNKYGVPIKHEEKKGVPWTPLAISSGH
jgi:hypothetical protein